MGCATKQARNPDVPTYLRAENAHTHAALVSVSQFTPMGDDEAIDTADAPTCPYRKRGFRYDGV